MSLVYARPFFSSFGGRCRSARWLLGPTPSTVNPVGPREPPVSSLLPREAPRLPQKKKARAALRLRRPVSSLFSSFYLLFLFPATPFLFFARPFSGFRPVSFFSFFSSTALFSSSFSCSFSPIPPVFYLFSLLAPRSLFSSLPSYLRFSSPFSFFLSHLFFCSSFLFLSRARPRHSTLSRTPLSPPPPSRPQLPPPYLLPRRSLTLIPSRLPPLVVTLCPPPLLTSTRRIPATPPPLLPLFFFFPSLLPRSMSACSDADGSISTFFDGVYGRGSGFDRMVKRVLVS